MANKQQVGKHIIREPGWEEFLLSNQPTERFREYYEKRLRKEGNNYWQILAEVETAYIFHNKFKIPVTDFNRKTIGNKDVDLTAQFGNEEIYIEVTSSQYKNGKNSDLQQDAKLERAMEHGSEKFSYQEINLLVIYDEQLSSQFYDPQYMFNNVPETYFNCKFFERGNGKFIQISKISALLLFGQRKAFEEHKRDFKIWKNPNANKQFNFDLNYSEIDDKEYVVSPEDKKLNKEFYGKK